MTEQQFIHHVESCQKAVRRFLTALCCGDCALADDLAQETFIKAYLSCETFRKDSQFTTWIYRIAYNYNPQNEMFAPRKTKRSLLKNETLLKPPFFKKIFDPASPGIGVAPAQYLNGLRTLSEGHSFSLWVAARPLFRFSLTRPRSTP